MTEAAKPAKVKDGRRAAAEKMAKAQTDAAAALDASHDAKVALQNAKFAELGAKGTKEQLADLGVTVND